MAEKPIIWTTRANLELKQILEYYIKRNGNSNYSLELLDEIEDGLRVISEHENIGRLTSNAVTRVLVLKVYLIFYEVKSERIEILSFWDNRQNPKNKIAD